VTWQETDGDGNATPLAFAFKAFQPNKGRTHVFDLQVRPSHCHPPTHTQPARSHAAASVPVRTRVRVGSSGRAERVGCQTRQRRLEGRHGDQCSRERSQTHRYRRVPPSSHAGCVAALSCGGTRQAESHESCEEWKAALRMCMGAPSTGTASNPSSSQVSPRTAAEPGGLVSQVRAELISLQLIPGAHALLEHFGGGGSHQRSKLPFRRVPTNAFRHSTSLRAMFGSAGELTRPAGCSETPPCFGTTPAVTRQLHSLTHHRVSGHHQLSQGSSTHSHTTVFRHTTSCRNAAPLSLSHLAARVHHR
jgi:hypothetical protein